MVINIVLGVVIVGYILWRQLQARPAREQSALRLVLILGIIGIVTTSSTVKGHHVAASGWAWLIFGLLVGAALGALRGLTTHVWRDSDGVAWRRGNWPTLVLWIVSLGAHLVIDVFVDHASGVHGLGTATIYLYLAVTLGLQREVIRARAARLAPGGASRPLTT